MPRRSPSPSATAGAGRGRGVPRNRRLLGTILAASFLGGAVSCGDSPSSPNGGSPTPPPDPTNPNPNPPPTRLPAVLGNPCPGATVRSDPPSDNGSHNYVQLVLEWENRARGASFDWAGPYFHQSGGSFDPNRLIPLEVSIADWSVETTGALTRHTIGVRWPPFAEFGLELQSGSGSCDLPMVVCSTSGCELRR